MKTILIDEVSGLESNDRHDDIAIASAMKTVEGSPSLNCFDAAISAVSMNAVALNGMNKEYVYDSMPNQQEQVIYPTMLSNRLDRIIGTRVEQSKSVQKGSFCSNPSKIWSINMDTSDEQKNKRRSKDR